MERNFSFKSNIIIMLIFVVLVSICMVGCDDPETLKIGANRVPHAQMLKIAEPFLKEKGVKIKIVEFDDYTLLNPSLLYGDTDANFFQHLSYLEQFNAENEENLVAVAKIHYELMAAYSRTLKDKKDLKPGAVVLIPNDATNMSRALKLLQSNNVIELSEDESGDEKAIYKVSDIIKNPKNLDIRSENTSLLSSMLDKVDMAIINANYAFEVGLNPILDAVFYEDTKEFYWNAIVTKKENKDDPRILTLVEVMKSEPVVNFIKDTYDGALIPYEGDD